MTSKRHAGFALLLGASFASVPVGAEDSLFPGTLCRPGLPNLDFQYTVDGQVRNLSTAQLEVECSILRENPDSQAPSFVLATLWVVNPGPAPSSLICALEMEDDNTNAFVATAVLNTSISSTPMPMFASLPAGGLDWAQHLRCFLPGHAPPALPASIKAIHWLEQ
jgi:hypothetical protein